MDRARGGQPTDLRIAQVVRRRADRHRNRPRRCHVDVARPGVDAARRTDVERGADQRDVAVVGGDGVVADLQLAGPVVGGARPWRIGLEYETVGGTGAGDVGAHGDMPPRLQGQRGGAAGTPGDRGTDRDVLRCPEDQIRSTADGQRLAYRDVGCRYRTSVC